MKKKWLFLILIPFVLILLIVLGSFFFYQYNKPKPVDMGSYFKVSDQLFNISYTYPKSWKDVTSPFGLSQGVRLQSTIDPNTTIMFWDADSDEINSIDELMKYVVNGVKNDESLGFKTVSIEKTQFNGKYSVLYTATENKDDIVIHHKRFYISVKDIHLKRNFVWAIQVDVEKEMETKDYSGVTFILDSFTFLNER